jgi:hypothetical protein
MHEEATTEMMCQMRGWLAEFPQLRLVAVLLKGLLNDITRHQGLVDLRVQQVYPRRDRMDNPLGDGSRGGLRGCTQLALIYAMLKQQKSPPPEPGICLLHFFLWCRSIPNKKYQINIGDGDICQLRSSKTGDLVVRTENGGKLTIVKYIKHLLGSKIIWPGDSENGTTSWPFVPTAPGTHYSQDIPNGLCLMYLYLTKR